MWLNGTARIFHVSNLQLQTNRVFGNWTLSVIQTPFVAESLTDSALECLGPLRDNPSYKGDMQSGEQEANLRLAISVAAVAMLKDYTNRDTSGEYEG